MAKNQAKPKKKPQPKRQRANKQVMRVCRDSVLPCVKRYAYARLAPFSPQARGACVPSGDGGSTFKYATRVRFEVTSGAWGAFLIVRPDASNNIASIFVGRKSAAEDTLNDVPENTTAFATGSPFANTAFGAGALEQRLVSWGIEAVSTTQNLNREGVCSAYVTPSGGNIIGTNGATGITNQPTSRLAVNNKGEVLKALHSLDNANEATTWYSSSNYVGSNFNYTGGLKQGPGCLYLNPTTSGEQTYLINYIAHWETRGRTVTPIGSTEKSDYQGFAKVFGSAGDILASMDPHLPSGNELIKRANHIMDGVLNPDNVAIATLGGLTVARMRASTAGLPQAHG